MNFQQFLVKIRDHFPDIKQDRVRYYITKMDLGTHTEPRRKRYTKKDVQWLVRRLSITDK